MGPGASLFHFPIGDWPCKEFPIHPRESAKNLDISIKDEVCFGVGFVFMILKLFVQCSTQFLVSFVLHIGGCIVDIFSL